jgi:hypothetical protein
MAIGAGLGLLEDGFEILLRCGKTEAANLNKLIADDPSCGSLPGHLINRTRFSIAHELAHTFFYNFQDGRPRIISPASHARNTKSLESTCNRIAGELLLPTKNLQRRLGVWENPAPNQLPLIALDARVSAPTLVSRFGDISGDFLPRAIVASVSLYDGNHSVTSVWRHYTFRHIFSQLKPGQPIREALPQFNLHHLVAFGGTESRVPSQRESDWLIECTAPNRNSYFLSLYRKSDWELI